MGEAPPLMAPSQAASNPPQSLKPITEPIIESDSLFQRRIEFHMARKISNGFGNCGGDKGGFQMEVLNPECGSGAGMNSNPVARVMKKPEAGDRNGLDSELLSLRLTFKRIGAGLQNLGNTCFLNSVLQCLTYTEPLAAYLQSGKHQTSCRAAGFCALCAIQRHVSRALNSSGRIVAPKDLVSNLRCISRNFRNSRQEDAHEYMVNLLESMHKCCLPSGVPSESPSAYERSLVHKIFGGRLRSQVKCLQCSYCSNKFDPFLDLSLEILKADTLYKALTHFTAKEQLDGGARQYQCQQCKQKVKALKQLTIYNPPHVLAIHLKRFGSHVQGQKINKKVDFGPTIDLKPFVSGSYDGDLKYTLYGVLVHAGWSTHSGHYYCFVRTSSGIWYSLDDNQVVQVGERKVLEQKAYMLFYVRDQKNFIPKTAVHKETVANFKGSKGSMQTLPIEGKSNGFGSHPSTKGNAVNGSALNEALVKLPADDSVSKADRSRPLYVNAKNSASVMNSLSNQNASALNGGLVKIQADSNELKVNHTSLDVKNSSSMKDSTVANLDIDKKVAASTEKATNSNMDAAANVRTSTLTLENGDRKIVNASAAELCQLTVPHFAAKENKCDPCKIISSCNGHAGVNKSVIDSVGRPFDSDGPGTAKDASYSKLGDSSQTDIDVGQKPELPTTLEILPRKKLAYRTSHLAVGKKFFRTPIMKMQLSTTIIFRKTLGIRNRKKPRGGRSCNLVNKKSGQDQLADRNFSELGLGPSTSENCEMPLHGLSTSSHDKKKKGNKSGGKDVTVLAESEKIICEVNGRVCLNDHVGSTENQQIEGYKSERADLAWSAGKRKEVNKNGVTTVLLETTVPRWDDVEVPVASVMESDKQESISIGYIGDEWDEDYDRGKQKKVRMNKFDFDGSNPFQETANRKAKRHFQETPSRKAKRKHKMEFGPGTKRFKV